MRLVRPFAALMLATLATAPAAAQGRGDAIPRLEAARARNPQNVAALRALGVAYYKGQRYADAKAVLEQATKLDPKDGVSALYAGLASEQVGDLTSARRAYESYLAVGNSRRAKDDIRTRLVSLARQEAIAAAKAAVANEARLSPTAGDQNTVAVPPFRFSGTDESLRPLERGIADLIVTDLAQVSRLKVVERDRMQALADEIQLSQSNRVDAATAVRAGRLIQAGTIVNGSIVAAPGTVTLDAALVRVANGQSGQAVTATNPLAQLFDMEKRLVLQLIGQLGIQLTPAERQAIDRRPTANLEAFLSYSRGLQAADDGRFQDAARFFENARSLDPGFGAASARFQAAQAAAQGAQVTTTQIEGGLSGSESQVVAQAEVGNVGRPAAGPGAPQGLGATIERITLQVNPPSVSPLTSTVSEPPPQRDPTSSTPGTDAVNRTGQVVIIIRRP
ncbi:MAG: tetratricopeptide repeat protein [Gemmatimonadaceae bacterium]|nr:tetratricopeptide repeat protein [Gemmatimonadaceae bacterium]